MGGTRKFKENTIQNSMADIWFGKYFLTLMVAARKSLIRRVTSCASYDDRPRCLIVHNWTMYCDVCLCVWTARWMMSRGHGEVCC